MAVSQIAVTIGGFWTTEDKAEAFFEKLEKKQEKLEKKQNCQQGESNPGFLCGRQVS